MRYIESAAAVKMKSISIIKVLQKKGFPTLFKPMKIQMEQCI